MSRLVSNIASATGLTSAAAETPVQRFFLAYAQAVDGAQYTSGNPLKYYSPDLVFHNQNNATYYGAAQMWPWMQKMFGQFARLQHPIHAMWEIEQADGESLLMVQMTRNVWVQAADPARAPDVSAPAFWVARIGPAVAGDVEAEGGLQFREVWLYWDTMLLTPFLGKEAVAFSTENVVEKQKA